MKISLWALYAAAVTTGAALTVHGWNAAVAIPRAASMAVPALRAWSDSAAIWFRDSDDVVVSSDPFRIARVPATVAYNPVVDGGGAIVAIGPVRLPVRPTLTLKAIVGGPPWQAIVDGIPGQTNGTVVRTGSTFDRLAVRVVTRDSVVVEGLDTSWTLGFHRHP